VSDVVVNHNDILRRIDALMELHWLWGRGLSALLQTTYHSEWEEDRIDDLEGALKLLTNYAMIGYSDVCYAHEINKLAELSKEDKAFFKLPENYKLPPLKEWKPNTGDMT